MYMQEERQVHEWFKKPIKYSEVGGVKRDVFMGAGDNFSVLSEKLTKIVSFDHKV